MNNFPGAGLGAGYTILGTPLGYAYETAVVPTTCKLYGRILKPSGEPVGNATRILTPEGLADGWQGVKVTVKLKTATDYSGTIIGVDRLVVETNDLGYFEADVIQGLIVDVSCPSLGVVKTIDTTGQTSIDLSTEF